MPLPPVCQSFSSSAGCIRAVIFGLTAIRHDIVINQHAEMFCCHREEHRQATLYDSFL
jgi:hypothetical protein